LSYGICLNGQVLPYLTKDRNDYRHYRSDPAMCETKPKPTTLPTGVNASANG